MAASFYIHDPNANLDYEIDWNDPADPWLNPGDSIAASTFTLVDVGAGAIVIGSTGLYVPTFTTTKTKLWVSGGTAGREYRVRNHISTDQGREEDQTIVFLVEEK